MRAEAVLAEVETEARVIEVRERGASSDLKGWAEVVAVPRKLSIAGTETNSMIKLAAAPAAAW